MFKRIFLSLLFSCFCLLLHAQPVPTRGQIQLSYWSFSDTNWLSGAGFSPVGYSNIFNLEAAGNGNSLLLDTTNLAPAYLSYNIVETGSITNLSLTNGTISLWFSPDWSSTNQGGGGPGNWGNLISLGQAGTNGLSWWSWYLSPDGCTINFSSQTNGTSPITYLSAPVSFEAGDWYNLVFTYSTIDSELYTNGVLVTNGLGMTYWPGSDVTSFSIGSDSNGFYQAQGVFDDLTTFNFEMDSGTVGGYFGMYSLFYFAGTPGSGPFLVGAPSTNSVTPTFNAVTGPGFLTSAGASATYVTSSNVWITNYSATIVATNIMNVSFAVAGGSNGVPYDVFITGVLQAPITNATWYWQGQGFRGTNYIIPITNYPSGSVYLILGTPQDTDQDGLTDAYERLITHTDPNNSNTSGDGILDGWKVVWGLNPSLDNPAQSIERYNYSYDKDSRLKGFTGTNSETITFDFEGNIQSDQR